MADPVGHVDLHVVHRVDHIRHHRRSHGVCAWKEKSMTAPRVPLFGKFVEWLESRPLSETFGETDDDVTAITPDGVPMIPLTKRWTSRCPVAAYLTEVNQRAVTVGFRMARFEDMLPTKTENWVYLEHRYVQVVQVIDAYQARPSVGYVLERIKG